MLEIQMRWHADKMCKAPCSAIDWIHTTFIKFIHITKGENSKDFENSGQLKRYSQFQHMS